MMTANWRIASRCDGQCPHCVSVGTDADKVGVRDTTQHGDGTVLTFSTRAWRDFAARLK
jgi:hypothetical protein